ncbi:MAG: hypothetical protein NTZ46_08705 [Verrucomicrobia bacterium]|nr:hypothetical protein [Verrucomicrobiota bacterium]
MDRILCFWNLPGVISRPPSWKTLGSLSLLAFLLVLTVLLRCWNHAEVFVGGKTFFVDPDCYSRMTRVQRVFEHPGTVVHRHAFENWPQGTQPHTTAPFDYLTAALAGGFRLFAPDSQTALDRAGAWISPLLGGLTAAFLWFWGGRNRGVMLFFFAVSPILVHATVLGRPDHQSLLLLCMAVALGAETKLGASRGWAVAGGLAWGLGLWVSLYEPLVLLALALLFNACRLRGRTAWAAGLLGVLLMAAFVDGWRWPSADPVVRAYFANWSKTIGELAHVSVPGLLHWTGWLLLPAPVLLAWLGWKKRNRTAGFWLVLLIALAALTCWQARWGYFLALVFAMALPILLEAFPKRWLALVVFAVSLWPMAAEWDRQLDPKNAALRVEQRRDNLALYEVAQTLRGTLRLPVLAPWWQSPALAYWSGQPCVAGSSHESLPGTVDASRFYLSADPAAAEAILTRRRVACVVVYDPERVNAVSSALLGQVPPQQGAMGQLLFERPHSPPPFLELAYLNADFRVYLYPPELKRQ